MKKLAVLVVAVIMIAFFASACGSASDVATDIGNAVAQLLKGNVKGAVGKTYSTQWFEFTVQSIEKVDSYAGYSPKSGYVLYDVVIKEKATFDEDILMGTFDFYMDAEAFVDYIFPLDPLDDTMMPAEFALKKNEVAEYHIIYEIPADTVGLMLCYTEIDENNSEGASFTIAVE